MRKSMSTNPILLEQVENLNNKAREEKAFIWREVSKRLSKSASRRPAVNVSKIARYTTKDDKVVVPGKILGSGVIDHPVTVAAFSFSGSAREKINSAGGRCVSIMDLANEMPKGTGVKIMG